MSERARKPERPAANSKSKLNLNLNLNFNLKFDWRIKHNFGGNNIITFVIQRWFQLCSLGLLLSITGSEPIPNTNTHRSKSDTLPDGRLTEENLSCTLTEKVLVTSLQMHQARCISETSPSDWWNKTEVMCLPDKFGGWKEYLSNC